MTAPAPDPGTIYRWEDPHWRAVFRGSALRLIQHNAAYHRRRAVIRGLAIEMIRAVAAGEIVLPRPTPPRIVLDDDDLAC